MTKSTQIAILTCGVICIVALFMSLRKRELVATLSMLPEEDAFVSYYQTLFSAADGLVKLKSKVEFDRHRMQIDAIVDRTVMARQKMNELDAQKSEQFRSNHEGLIKQSTDAMQTLVKWHKARPEILGENWEQYAAKLGAVEVSSD